jgi:uncharacterized membrane protein
MAGEAAASAEQSSEERGISSLCQNKTGMARMKKVLAFPSCFFLSVVAPLYLEELDRFTPRDITLHIQDLYGVLGV